MSCPESHGRPREGASAATASAVPEARLAQQLRPTILSVLVLTLLTGGLFPLVLFAIATPLFPRQAAGSLIMLDGRVVGSQLIGQEFGGSAWFQARPSAAGQGYDGTASGGTNLAPGNPRLKEGASDFTGMRTLAAQYRERNGLAIDTPIPIDAVTRSGSGLDPDISPVNAYLQMARVARVRGLPEERVRRLIAEHVQEPLAFLGEPRVSVLELNLALARLRPEGPSAGPAH